MAFSHFDCFQPRCACLWEIESGENLKLRFWSWKNTALVFMSWFQNKVKQIQAVLALITECAVGMAKELSSAKPLSCRKEGSRVCEASTRKSCYTRLLLFFLEQKQFAHKLTYAHIGLRSVYQVLR